MIGTIEKMPIRNGEPRDFTFVKGDDGVNYFLHITSWKHSHWKKLTKGKFPVKVQFTPSDGPKGPVATECKFVDNVE